ncbi:Nitrogen permease regulator 2 [Cichlidogyrus casuarinus]|uniref:Nitrogen permease regulator 2 n=1 Tax=Cichlidogyrus casuarinus TaxID=1844966 RepID=A0ABD2Q1C9_9PLAT
MGENIKVNPLAKEAFKSKSVNRIAEKPLWLPDLSNCDTRMRSSRKAYQETAGLEATSFGRPQRTKSLSLKSSGFSPQDYQMPMTTVTRTMFEQRNSSTRPGFRRLARRRDLIQLAPPCVPIETRTNYRKDFMGEQNQVRVNAIVPEDQGINGLETFVQILKRKQEKPVTRPSECPIDEKITSIYRNDFQKPFEMLALLEDKDKVLHPDWTNRDNGTDYRDNYHSWINFDAPEAFTFAGWKPSVAVYVAPDPAKREKMASSTVYSTEFRGDPLIERAMQRKFPSSIDRLKLINSVNGVEALTPKSLYRDSFVPHRNVHNWSERHIHQNLKALSKQVGLSHDDEIYWKDVPVDAYCHYKKAVFSKAPKRHLTCCQ